jgi:hypothetical protein
MARCSLLNFHWRNKGVLEIYLTFLAVPHTLLQVMSDSLPLLPLEVFAQIPLSKLLLVLSLAGSIISSPPSANITRLRDKLPRQMEPLT